MNCLPYDLKINAEVPMQQRIARVVGRKDWQFRMCRHEFGEVLCDVSAGLSNDLKVSDHGILVTRTPAELGIAQTGCIVFDPIDGFENVVQKIVQLK